jgi:hypothetical protein
VKWLIQSIALSVAIAALLVFLGFAAAMLFS